MLFRQPPASGKILSNRFSAFCLASFAAVSLIVGCQSQGELPNTQRGLAGALAPTSVQQYAQQRGISNDQARHELQQKVSDQDAQEAIKNIDDAGVVQR